ncbi:MAG: ribonuclease Z [Clostridia bacterium]|nr:ribonuclease Z [Clostridia bacterium]
MKITILGTGCIWTKRACASYLINDDVIVDPGSGTLKQLLKSSNKLLHHEKIEKIKLILISHYHLDHYFDVAHLMWKIASEKNPNSSATIICPPGGEERIKLLCQLGMSTDTYNKLNFEKYIKFVDASTMGKFKYNNFEITSYKMDHGSTECYGYLIKEKDGKTVAFTGDTNYCENMQKMIDKSDVAFVDMAGTDISNKHFNIIDGIKMMRSYKGKCNIVPCHLTSQALDYCVGRITPPKDLMVLDTSLDVPYDFELKKEKEEFEEPKNFKFATDKFDRIEGDIIDLKLSQTTKASASHRFPSYIFDVCLHGNGTVVGTINFSVVPKNIDGHNDNVLFSLQEDYDLKSVKYECCQLVKQVAKHHGSNVLYLTSSPKDLKTRRVFESLGAYLKEIKTYTYYDESKKRKTREVCIWVWELEK